MNKKYTRCIFFQLMLVGLIAQGESFFQPGDLTCENVTNPLGIDRNRPHFSWTIKSTFRNQKQKAYEILVSDDFKKIQQFEGKQWTSGRVDQNENLYIVYAGEPLKSFTRYFWRVRIYNEDDLISQWSEINWFETAMLSQSDWQAKWIGDGSKQFEHDADFYQADRMPLFRKEFSVAKRIKQARLYISGLGYYEAYLNEKRIGDNVLDPGWTTYKKQVLYVTYDVTLLIRTGKNVAGIMLGNGWYNPLPLRLFGQYNLRHVQDTGRPCVKAELHLEYFDGTREVIPTNEQWQTASGPIVRNNVYLGEHYDARLEQDRWNSLGSKVTAWKMACIANGPTGKLTPQLQPPIKVTRVLKPTRILPLKNNVFMVDMGQNFAGVARIRVKGKAGTKITLRFGEALNDDGTLNFLTTVAGHIKEMWNLNGGPGAPLTAWQEDSYTLKGSGVEEWSPRFTFHGFRFIEISGWPGTPTINDIDGLRMNAVLPLVGSFTCSNEMFNNLHEVTQWTFLSNVFSVQSDCPGREKMSYGADLVTTANAYMFNYDMHTFYTKAVNDFANDQQSDGAITEMAPYTGIAVKGYGGHSGPLGWQLAFPYLQKQLYSFYGDKRIIAEHYESFLQQMKFLEANAVDELYYWDISDHMSIDPKPEAFSAAVFYYHHAFLAAEFAAILNRQEDSVRFTKLRDQIKQKIISTYWIPKTGRFDNATQSAQLFALWHDLSPEKEKSFAGLLAEIERHNDHVSAGIFGVMMMFDVLRLSNRNDVAYRVANQPDYPGWGYMLSKGATTLWESWEYPVNSASQNHPMFGSIDEWFYRSLLGINPVAPGFKKIQIKPQPAGDLQWAKGNYKSVNGLIKSDWRILDNTFVISVSIPFNTTAEVWVPSKEGTDVLESNSLINSGSEIKFLRRSDGYAIYQVGSGDYLFTAIL